MAKLILLVVNGVIHKRLIMTSREFLYKEDCRRLAHLQKQWPAPTLEQEVQKLKLRIENFEKCLEYRGNE